MKPWSRQVVLCLSLSMGLCSCTPQGETTPQSSQLVEGLCSSLEQAEQAEQTTITLSETSSNDVAFIGLVYGYDRPFIDAERKGTDDDPLDLPIEYGLQGGHHIDLSLRFIGNFNPDLVDLSIVLEVDQPLTQRFEGHHNTQDWYLLFAEENEPMGCYFHRARIFLFDEIGAPVQAWGVDELDGSSATLSLTLHTEGEQHHWRARGILRDGSRNELVP